MRLKLRTLLTRTAAQWRWFLRVFVAAVVLGALAPAPPRAPLGEAQSVETEHPIVCAHTRLIDEVDEWKIQRSVQMVREMGATSIVEFFPWAYIESADDQFDWGSADRIVRHARNQGLHIIARTGLVPEWARRDVDADFSTLNYLPESAYPEFAEFITAFAERYAGVIDHIIIWNEPNLAFEWGYRDVDPAGYAALLRAVYHSAHAANPNVVILVAPLAPTLEPEGSANGLNDLLYLDQLYEAGASPYFDALAVHTYGFTEAPDAEPAFDVLNFRRAELLHEIMERHGDGETPVYITETGWNDHPRWTKAVRPSLRGAYTVEAFQYAEANWPWLEKMCLWAFRYPADTFNYPDNFTLVTTDFQPKPIYYAVQAYARGWQQEGALWLPAPSE
jgi:polysaccharide biosynthesis protein PslG